MAAFTSFNPRRSNLSTAHCFAPVLCWLTGAIPLFQRAWALAGDAVSDSYENRVFFMRNRGFITRTEAPQTSFEETLHFERIHEETHRGFAFELVPVEPGDLRERVSVIKAAILAPKLSINSLTSLPSG